MNKNHLRILAVYLIISIIISNNTTVYAAGNQALSVGTDYGLSDINTSQDAYTAASYYRQPGLYTYTETVPSSASILAMGQQGTLKLRSDVLFFSGHGNAGGMRFQYKGGSAPYNFKITMNQGNIITGNQHSIGLLSHMPYVKLVVFAGCKTANNSKYNITVAARDNGAKVAIGWRESIYEASHSQYLTNFNQKLGQGGTIRDAIQYANSFPYFDSRVYNLSAAVGKQSDMDLKISNKKSSSLSDDMNNVNRLYLSENIYYDSLENSLKNISDNIQIFDKSFDIKNFSVKNYIIEETGMQTLILSQMINGFETDVQYMIHIESNEVTSITCTKNNLDLIIPQHFRNLVAPSSNEVGKYLKTAKEDCESKTGYSVTQQTYRLIYDTEQNTPYIYVFSTYMIDDGNDNYESVYQSVFKL